jgi:hypothetical protein
MVNNSSLTSGEVVVYVNSLGVGNPSFPGPFTKISQALSYSNVTTILLLPGTHLLDSESVTVGRASLTIASANETAATISSIKQNSYLQFINFGNITLDNLNFQNITYSGATSQISNAVNVLVSNCVFQGNKATSLSSLSPTLNVINAGSTRILNSSFKSNSGIAVGAAFFQDTNLEILNSTFYGNSGSESAHISVKQTTSTSKLAITNCLFTKGTSFEKGLQSSLSGIYICNLKQI